MVEKHSDVLEGLADFKKDKEDLEESSLSRIWQHVTDEGRSFAVISSGRGDYSWDENVARLDVMKVIARKWGYGFIETIGGYKEEEGGVETVEEPSLFIPEISIDEAVRIGGYFRQESIIYKDSDFFGMIGSSSFQGEGTIIQNFKKDVDDVLDLTNVEDFFSALVKGSHAGKKFVFRPKE